MATAGLAGAVAFGIVGCGQQPDSTSTESDAGSEQNGQQDPPSGDTERQESDDDGDGGAAPEPSEPDPAEVPPNAIVLHRSGGVAGVADELVVTTDGTATLTSRSEEPLTCTVEDEVMSRITSTTDDFSEEATPPVDPDYERKNYPDKLDTYLLYQGERVHHEQLPEDATQWRQLFDSMSQVLGAATALQKDTAAPDGDPACTV